MGVTGLWESVKDLKKPFRTSDELKKILSTEKNSDAYLVIVDGSNVLRSLWHTMGVAILFGGVSDLKESEDSLESICHNDAYQYHETNKWYPLTVKNLS